MVRGGFKFWQKEAAPCGTLCQSVRNEIDAIGNAEALARLARKQRIQRRGTRER